MAKRKAAAKKDESYSNSDSEDSSEQKIVNVDFDFFDLNPDVDYQAIKNLLRQTLDADNARLDLSALTDLILEQARAQAIGSTIKTDGPESDPFAFLALVPISPSKLTAPIREYLDYLLSRCRTSNKDLCTTIQTLTEATYAGPKTAILFSERLINMPTEVIPPMYRMFLDELERSSDSYDQFFLLSKSYQEVSSQLDNDADDYGDLPRSKRTKKTKSRASRSKLSTSSEVFYFHAEDEILRQHSITSSLFQYATPAQEADSRRTFLDYGIAPQGLIVFISKSELRAAVKIMLETFAIPAP
ncbi:protein BCP1 [Lipomyces oligophaga]|uniref:protein BCP1 n=1 Tax=Lipomyces oligophaga TaxID=45792 RepID=UPI0034CFB5ED